MTMTTSLPYHAICLLILVYVVRQSSSFGIGPVGLSKHATSSTTQRTQIDERKQTAVHILSASASMAEGSDDLGKISMEEKVREELQEMISRHNVIAFIKGNRLMPQCGFSGTMVNILQSLAVPFETVDVLADDRIRQGIKDYSNWPTIPQLYLAGEFVGGTDIIIELYQSGELQEMIEVAAAS